MDKPTAEAPVVSILNIHPSNHDAHVPRTPGIGTAWSPGVRIHRSSTNAKAISMWNSQKDRNHSGHLMLSWGFAACVRD